MLKKSVLLILGAAAICAAFGGTLERNAQQAMPENHINVESIVDWNTDGEEISLMLDDGSELYAYKSENVYDDCYNHFASVAEIVGWEVTDTGILLKMADGSGYYIEK